jgi:hypothetical protein
MARTFQLCLQPILDHAYLSRLVLQQDFANILDDIELELQRL